MSENVCDVGEEAVVRHPWLVLTCMVSVLGTSSAAAQPRRMEVEADIETGAVWQHFPVWNKGFLLTLQGDWISPAPVLHQSNRNGQLEAFLLTIPDVATMDLRAFAAGPDGQIGATGFALSNTGQLTTFVCIVSPDRKNQVVVRVWPLRPSVLAFAPDGSIWTVGYTADDHNSRIISKHVLRHYDASGVLLLSLDVQARGQFALELSALAVSPDVVGWLTREGEYIEFAHDGREVGRYDLPVRDPRKELTGLALRDDGLAIAGAFSKSGGGFLALDRQSKTWKAMEMPAKHGVVWTKVLGFDGTRLVTTKGNGKLRKYRLN